MELRIEDFSNTTISLHDAASPLPYEADENEFEYKIINVVALGILKLPEGTQIDFDEVGQYLEVRKLNRFPSILFKIDNISVILFRNGKCILTGIKSQEEIPILKEKLEATFEKGHIKYEDFEIQIQNFVVMTNLNRIVNLELSCILLTNCLYEPEQFPAAIVKPPEGGTFLVFSNSKIIGLGMRDIKQLQGALSKLIQQIFDLDLFIDPNNSKEEEIDDDFMMDFL